MCHNLSTRQRTKTHGIDFDCRVPVEAHGKPNGQANGSPGPPVCRVPNVRHTTNKPGCRVFVMAHGKLPSFAVCFIFAVRFFQAHGKRTFCRVFFVCRVFFFWLTANGLVAVCPKFCTRQRLGHTAKYWIPVVYYAVAPHHLQPKLIGAIFLMHEPYET